MLFQGSAVFESERRPSISEELGSSAAKLPLSVLLRIRPILFLEKVA